MKKVQIIGVPEHFNLPWHMSIEEGAFLERGIDLKWKNIPEGTGKMAQLLQDHETDLAIILTEGLIRSISEGNSAKIVQTYVKTPLYWGIHVGALSTYETLADLAGKTAAISRFGSGSHLMSYVLAQNENWPIDDLQFEVVNNLEGAITALTQGKADYFLWEHFTTKPLVDKNIFRRLGDCPTPWPCFVIAASEKFIKKEPGTLNHILEVINNYTSEFKMIPSIDRTLANRYDQKLEDIREWLNMTQWGQHQIEPVVIAEVQQRLLDLQLIDKKLPFNEICY